MNEEFEEKDQILKDPSRPEKYVTRMFEKISNKEALISLLKMMKKIDFAVEFWDDDDEAIVEILNIRAMLNIEEGIVMRIKLKKALAFFEPKLEEKYVLVIEQLLLESQKMKIELAVNNNCPYYFDPKIGFWEYITAQEVQSFLPEVATKSGINRVQARSQKEVIKLYNQFECLAEFPEPTINNSVTKINLKNGTFVFGDGEPKLVPFNSGDFFKYKLPFDFDPTAKAPKFLKYLNEVVPEIETQMVMAEYIGYVFAKHLKLEKCLVLVGGGENGKSVFFDVIRGLLGDSNILEYSLSKICNSEYYRVELSNYLLNYSSEMGGKGCDPDIVKQLISNEPVTARSPYEKPIMIYNYCRFMFNSNVLPKDIEYSHGYARRFMYAVFDVTITKEQKDTDLAKKIINSELSGVFNWVIEGMNRLLKNKNFTNSKSMDDMFKKVNIENNSVALFIQENEYFPVKSDEVKKVDFKTLTELRDSYEKYCTSNGYRPVSTIELSRRLKNLGFEVKPKCTNNSTRVYFTNHVEIPLINEETQNLLEKFINRQNKSNK
jgi:putative DNA primase/helicase